MLAKYTAGGVHIFNARVDGRAAAHARTGLALSQKILHARVQEKQQVVSHGFSCADSTKGLKFTLATFPLS